MQDKTNRIATYSAPGEGQPLDVFGIDLLAKIPSEVTGGDLALHEFRIPAGHNGPPPHVHSLEDELFYVLEGTIHFQLGNQTVRGEAGTAVFGPRGILHKFWNESDSDARAVALVTPGAFAAFFHGVDALSKDPSYEPAKGLALAKDYGVEFPSEISAENGPNASGLHGHVSRPREGRHTPYKGGRIEVLVPTEQTGGTLSLIDSVSPSGEGPIAHIHDESDELFYVTEGEVLVQVGDKRILAKKGSALYVPRGTLHSLRAVGPTPFRGIAYILPGGFEEFFFEMNALEEAGEMSLEKAGILAARYDTRVVLDIPQLKDLSDAEIEEIRGETSLAGAAR